MPRKPQSGKLEMLSRNVEIASFSATVRLSAVHRVERAEGFELMGRMHMLAYDAFRETDQIAKRAIRARDLFARTALNRRSQNSIARRFSPS